MAGTTEGGGQARTYRATPVVSLFVTLFFGGGALGALGPFFTDDAPAAVVIPLTAVVAPLALGVVVAVWRSKTVIDEDGVAVRRLFRTRRMSWRDIQAVGAGEIPGTAGGAAQPTGPVTVDDRTGRRTTLPHLYDRRGLSLRHEMTVIDEWWVRGRGADWAPEPVTADRQAATAANARTGERIRTATERGRLVALLLLVAELTLAVVVMLAGVPDDLPGPSDGVYLWSFAVLPVAAFAVTFFVSYTRERHR